MCVLMHTVYNLFLLGNLGSIFQAVELYSAELHVSSAAVNGHLFIVWPSTHKG